jgi:PD-(D/E)XK endonuclease
VRRTYGPHEIDALGAYSAELDRCYLIPIARVPGQKRLRLRLAPAKNCQVQGIHFAEQYELGAIAQLGERQSGTLEAAGSSPASST